MKNIIGLLIIGIFGLISCNNEQTASNANPIPDIKTEIGKINDFLKQYEEPSQVFKVLADKPEKVTGKQGTVIYIDPDNLIIENGQPIGKSIEVELKELTNQEQLLRTNAQTASNGKLLISGGAYFINMTSDGRQLKLRDGKKLSVAFPKISSREMSLFYGQRDTLRQLNWQQAEKKLESKPKPKVVKKSSSSSMSGIEAILGYVEHESNRTLTAKEKKEIEENNKKAEEERKMMEKERKRREKEEKKIEEEYKNYTLNAEVYKAVELDQLGWINCDRFNDVPNKTNLLYAFNGKDKIGSANVYLVFKDINSVLQSSYFSFNNREYNLGFQDVPVGAKTQLVAFSVKNGKIYTYKSDLTIKANETIQLTLKETSLEQMDKLFKSN